MTSRRGGGAGARRRPARKRVFILGGGASLGAHPVGATRLLEERGIRPDALVAGPARSASARAASALAAGRARAAGALAAATFALGGAGLGCAGGGAARTVVLPAAEARAPRPERLVLVSAPGLVPADYLGADATPAAPTVAALGRAGLLAEAVVPVFPAASVPAHVALVTGADPVASGVPADRPLDPARGVSPAPFEAAAIQAPALWQAVAGAGGAVAALDWPATGGATMAELLPDVGPAGGAGYGERLARGGTPRAVALARAAGADDPRAAQPGPVRDAVLVEVACTLLADTPGPRLLLLRLSGAAAARERAAPGSEAMRGAVAGVDAQVARLVSCLARSGRLASSALVVTGDHGSVSVHTALRPNAVLAEAGLVRTDRGGIAWDALARSNGGGAFVYAQSADLAILARRALEEAARETGAFRVLSAEEMLARGADPHAWFGLEASPGFVFEDGAAGPAVAPAGPAGAGGYAPGEPRLATGLVAWGAGLRAGVRVPALRQVDVGPTLAQLLGVRLDGARGRVMVGLLGDGRADAAAPAAAPPARRGRE